MKYLLITLAILIINLILNISIAFQPDIEIQWSRILDKEKHVLIKKLKVKKEIIIRQNYFESDSTKKSIWLSVNEYDKDGNQLNYKVYSDSLMIEPRFEEHYVTDENGNIIKAYRKGKLIATQEFDDEGRIIELINFDGDSEERWTWKYKYDEMGNEVFKTQYLYGELIDTLLSIKYEYETIKDKILIKSKECLLDTSDIFYEVKEFFIYDNLGREIEYQEYRRNNSIYFVRNTDYKTLSRIRNFYFPDGSIEQIDSIKINQFGKDIERFTYQNGILIRKNFNTFNPQGLMLSELRLSETGKKFFEHKYNEIGQEIYLKSFVNDTLIFMRSSDYLENGLIIKYEEINFNNRTTKLDIYNYEFY